MRRRLAVLALAALSISCASRRPALLEAGAVSHSPPEPKPATPARAAEEVRPPRWLPSSDEVWLLEMIAQRLEIAMAAARGREVWGISPPAAAAARGALFAELAARAGLAPGPARFFYAAQERAAAEAERVAARAAGRDVRAGKTVLAPAAASALMDAVEAQMVATLLRLGGIPSDDRLVRFGRERLAARGVPSRAARIALSPLSARAGSLTVFTTSEEPR
ncbi:MAG: hypothetical protein N2322_00665 [Terrimicrobiaceae bacterium]|nr:hypothetical protein [Terrimicrobiaceae bacterium]